MAAPVAARWKDAGSFWDVCTWSFLGTLGGEDERQGENQNRNQPVLMEKSALLQGDRRGRRHDPMGYVFGDEGGGRGLHEILVPD